MQGLLIYSLLTGLAVGTREASLLPGYVMTDLDLFEIRDAFDRRGRVTRAMRRDRRMKPMNVLLVVDPGGTEPTLVAVARLHKGPIFTSFERRVTVGALVDVDPLPGSLILQGVSPGVRTHARSILLGGGQIPPKTWGAIRDVLRERYQEVWQEIQTIEAARTIPDWVMSSDLNARRTIELEKDGTGLALSLSGMDRSSMARWTPGEEPAPFLSGLDELIGYEDPMIERDLSIFGSWELIRRSLVGAVEFQQRDQRVTVANVNRRSVEQTMGVDLVYYHHTFRSFVLVQYKRMTQAKPSKNLGAPSLVFEPNRDPKFGSQLQAMLALEDLAGPPGGSGDFRFSPSTTYLKLCNPRANLFDDGLVRGMYLPTSYADLLVKSPEVVGPRGGIRITYENVGRHLSNTQFIELFQSGFIGSGGIATDQIEQTVKTLLENDHSVILAAGNPR